MEKADIRALTGLRGVAAVLVTIYHFYPPGDMGEGVIRETIGRGYLWVDLFFVLSGYVIALNYRHLFAEGTTREAFAVFLLRRVARLYPLYLAILAARVAYTLIAHGNFSPPGDFASVITTHPARDLIANLFLVQSWGLATSIVGTAWSVSTEMAAYLLFPMLATVTLFQGWRPALVAALAALALIGGVAMLNQMDGAYHSGPLDAYDGTRWAPLMRCLGGFILGLLVFRAGQSRAIAGFMARGWVSLALVALFGGLLAAGVHDLIVVALFPPLVLALAQDRGPVARGLSGALILRLGALSYAIYLLHPLLEAPHRDFVLWLRLHHVLPLVAHGIAGLAVVITLYAASSLAFEWIERPGRRLVRALELRWIPARAEKPSGRFRSAP